MHETHDRREPGADPLAELIRAAGRRSAPPRAHYEQVFAATHAVWQRKIAARRRGRWLALAASVAAVVVVGAIVQAMLPPEPAPAATVAFLTGRIEYSPGDSQTWQTTADSGAQLRSGTRVRTGADSRAALRLAGGGSLRVDAETELVLGNGAFELVAGALYFDSEGRPAASPVEVMTALGVVRDIGTQFEVRTTPASLRVRVRSGQIAVIESPVAGDILSRAGNEIELSTTGMLVERPFAPDDPAWSWAESLAVAPSAQAQSILAWLTWISHETGKRLEFDSRSVELRARLEDFVGDPEGLTPMELLGLIAATSDFRYELTDDGAILIRRAAEP
jgi:ferric-dicitrate binding protein FerR (iron transport regulator)